MNYVKSSEEMFRTTDYDAFKRVLGNRKVLEDRVSKILASFDKIGYIPVPIIVNEKFEVIDGQGRLEACKRRGLPRWEGPFGTPLGLVHWKRASSPVEAGTAGYL